MKNRVNKLDFKKQKFTKTGYFKICLSACLLLLIVATIWVLIPGSNKDKLAVATTKGNEINDSSGISGNTVINGGAGHDVKPNSNEQNKKIIKDNHHTFDVIPPLKFNVSGPGVTLIYNSNSLSRRDTFVMPATETMEDLVTAIESNYKLTPPVDLINQYASGNGGYKLKEVIWAEHKPLISMSKLKNFDVIEFHYELINSETMACPPQKIRVQLNGVFSKNAVLYLNGKQSCDQPAINNSSTQFNFTGVMECNVESWFCELVTDNKTLYFSHPQFLVIEHMTVLNFKTVQ